MTWAAGDRPLDELDDTSARNASASTSGTSIADPVMLELALRWFCPPAGRVLDPFAGGTSGAAVASVLGFDFTGVEVRQDQVDINRALCERKGWRANFVCADSSEIDEQMPGGQFDFVMTDPPYFTLEVYSRQEKDGSTKKGYPAFLEWYANILRRAASVLKDDRFMFVKIGEARDKRGAYPNLVGDTSRVLIEAGLVYYNSMILVTAVGSLPVRAARAFESGRKVGTTHQHCLLYCKGDPKRATKACGPVTVPKELFETEAAQDG
jgi:DNA modification methylase